MKLGRVALVGAGTGDPGLLTLRAAELLRVADVVVHHELISEAILAMVPARAELIAFGRRAGESGVACGLHPELKKRALAGQDVVQLELGDPLSVTRCEEVEALAVAGVVFEVVRGVSATIGAVTSGVLVGKTIVVARARPGPSETGRRLRDLGATAIELPHVEKASSTPSEPLNALRATPVIVAIAGHRRFAPARWPLHVDLIVLPSSLSAMALYSQAPPSIFKIPAIAIGPRSAEQATRSGALDVRTAARDTIEDLVVAVVEFLRSSPGPSKGPAPSNAGVVS